MPAMQLLLARQSESATESFKKIGIFRKTEWLPEAIADHGGRLCEAYPAASLR